MLLVLVLPSRKIIGYAFADTTHIDFSSSIIGDIANASIGEKGIRITPLQTAVMICMSVPTEAISVTGRPWSKGVYDNNNNALEEYSSEVENSGYLTENS